MRTRILIFLLPAVICITQASFCQDNTSAILKFAPLSLMDPYGENIHFGAEFISDRPLSVETDLAFYIRTYDMNFETPRIKDRKGFKIKPEIRYYLNSEKKGKTTYSGLYIADELYLISDRFKRGDTFAHYDFEQDTSYTYFAYEKIRRLEIGNNIKIGYQAVTKIKLTFDFFFGLGLKYHHGTYDFDIADPPCCPVMRIFEVPVMKGLKPGVTFGIKLGYAL